MGCAGSKDGAAKKGSGLKKLPEKELKMLELEESSDEVFKTYNEFYKAVCEPNNTLCDNYAEMQKSIDAMLTDAEQKKQVAADPKQALPVAIKNCKDRGIMVVPTIDPTTGDVSAKMTGDLNEQDKAFEASLNKCCESATACGKAVPELQPKAEDIVSKATSIDMNALSDAAKEKCPNPMDAAKVLKTLKENVAGVKDAVANLKIMVDNVAVVTSGLKGDTQA